MAAYEGPCVGGPLDGQILISDINKVSVQVHVDSVASVAPGLATNFANVPASSVVVYRFYYGLWVYQ
jgi:hypothetical protein